MIQQFLLENWFDLVQTLGIIASLYFTYRLFQNETRSQKMEHLLQLNQSHRDIWNKTYSHPELLRIRKADVDLQKNPITDAEKRLSTEVIMHIYSVYEAIQNKQLDNADVEKDIVSHLKLPIPNTVWNEIKKFQNQKFVKYIDDLLQQ